jgi:acetyltransferase-like isoleucine patch superfamily enzyme
MAHPSARIKGLQNISTEGGMLSLILSNGPMDGDGVTRFDVQGKLRVFGDFAVGRGCLFDIRSTGTVELGHGSYINCRTQMVIKHGLRIGKECSISWECQFLDDDFHHLFYEGQRKYEHNDITIGDRVWIGSRVSIYKGTTIPRGCVVASNSVVKGVFTEENALLAGNPARVIKRNVSW